MYRRTQNKRKAQKKENAKERKNNEKAKEKKTHILEHEVRYFGERKGKKNKTVISLNQTRN